MTRVILDIDPVGEKGSNFGNLTERTFLQKSINIYIRRFIYWYFPERISPGFQLSARTGDAQQAPQDQHLNKKEMYLK